jgi:hypothetical protein
MLTTRFRKYKEIKMFIDLYSKDSRRPKWNISVSTGGWDDIIEELEKFINTPGLCDYKDEIDYLAIKGNTIKYYKVNIFIKNLTKKITLIPLKERPKNV